MSFFTQYLQDAKNASAMTAFYTSVILAQWALETGYGGSRAFQQGNNYAGVSGAGGVTNFPSKAAGLSAYIQTADLGYYDGVRAVLGLGPKAQMIALGISPWAGDHYDNADWANQGSPSGAWNPPNPGIDLINLYYQNNLIQFDYQNAPKNWTSVSIDQVDKIVGATPSGSTSVAAAQAAAANAPNPSNAPLSVYFPTLAVGKPIPEPAWGPLSDLQVGNFYLDGAGFDVNLLNSLVAPQYDAAIDKASTITLTIADPDRILINTDIFLTKTILSLGSSANLQQGPAAYSGIPSAVATLDQASPAPGNSWVLVSVQKQGSVLTATFEAYVVNALRGAVGAITAAPNTMNRSQFAQMLVEQVVGAAFSAPPPDYYYSLGVGYARATQEVMSRGTTTNPSEDSWTCLQRLASEIGFVCFESGGTVYFGDEKWLALQPPVFAPLEGWYGTNSIDGTYDIGQTDATLTVTASAPTWVGNIGDCISIGELGVLNGNWLISEIQRDNLLEPDITFTLSQPQPSLPEPASGGAQPAVGAGYTAGGSQQSTGGTQAAQGAVAFCKNQLGKPYAWGGVGPTGFDCSGLIVSAYGTQGISLPHNTVAMWTDPSLIHVPAGLSNLQPGDVAFFSPPGEAPPGHCGMIVSINSGTGTFTMIDAPSQGAVVRYDTIDPNTGSGFGPYNGAIRPAP